MFSTGNQTVDSIGMINFAGNVIPAEWYKTITKENGKAHLLAIVILADIVFWYRPTEVRDEKTGQMIGYKKKFASDLLQRSYDDIAELVGEDKRAVKRAIDVLEKLGVIRIEFRTVTYSNGKKANNVMFIDLNADKLFEITYKPITKNGNSLLPKMVIAYYQKWQQPITKIGNTNTENTIHRLHTDISSSSCTDKDIQGEDEEEEIKNQINYKELGKEFGHVVDLLVSSILELKPSIRQKVTPDIAMEVCRTYKSNKNRVVIPVKYMTRCMSSLIDGGIPPDKVTPFAKQNSFTSGSLIRSDIDFDELEKNILSN